MKRIRTKAEGPSGPSAFAIIRGNKDGGDSEIFRRMTGLQPHILVDFFPQVCYDRDTKSPVLAGGEGDTMQPSTVWMIVFIALLVGEALTVGLTFIWFAVGALGGLITTVLGGNIWVQFLVFLLLSGLSLALVRPFAAKLMKTSRTPTNADRVIGKTAVVTETIDNVKGKGQVNVAGQIWSARSEYEVAIPAGAEVRILRIEGVKLFVEAV